jgi:hypothetical protein
MLARLAVGLGFALITALAATGCGGAGYKGDVKVPKGYETTKVDGVSFVRPASFTGHDLKTAAGLLHTQYGDPAVKGGEGAFVGVSTLPNARRRFETIVSDARSVIESTDGKVDVKEVDVPGAEKAYRSTIEAGDVRSQMLEVLLEDGTYVSLSAGAPKAHSGGVDAGAVLDSFRVEGASEH